MKHGDIVFVRNEFNIHDPGTYMAWGIRTTLSANNHRRGLKWVKYNHIAIVVEIDGVLYLFEAGWNKEKRRGEIIKTKLSEWLKVRTPEEYLVKEPLFEFDKDKLKDAAIASLGIRYSIKSVLLAYPIKLLFFRRLWLGKRHTKSFFCSDYCLYLFHVSTEWGLFERHYETDPEEVYYLKFFKEKKD